VNVGSYGAKPGYKSKIKDGGDGQFEGIEKLEGLLVFED
jgi:hypothetical protein